MELNEEELKNVMAGNVQGMSEEKAIENTDLFRKEKIEQLKQEKEELEKLKKQENLNEFGNSRL